MSQPDRVRGVLLIDDEETSRYVLRQRLGSCGALQIQEAGTGADGLRLARLWRPGLVLLDVRLPDIDGCNVMDRLRADPSTADIPAIVCTFSVLAAHQRNRPAHAKTIRSKASLTREVMQRTLGEIWSAGSPHMPEAPGCQMPEALG